MHQDLGLRLPGRSAAVNPSRRRSEAFGLSTAAVSALRALIPHKGSSQSAAGVFFLKVWGGWRREGDVRPHPVVAM